MAWSVWRCRSQPNTAVSGHFCLARRRALKVVAFDSQCVYSLLILLFSLRSADSAQLAGRVALRARRLLGRRDLHGRRAGRIDRKVSFPRTCWHSALNSLLASLSLRGNALSSAPIEHIASLLRRGSVVQLDLSESGLMAKGKTLLVGVR